MSDNEIFEICFWDCNVSVAGEHFFIGEKREEIQKIEEISFFSDIIDNPKAERKNIKIKLPDKSYQLYMIDYYNFRDQYKSNIEKFEIFCIELCKNYVKQNNILIKYIYYERFVKLIYIIMFSIIAAFFVIFIIGLYHEALNFTGTNLLALIIATSSVVSGLFVIKRTQRPPFYVGMHNYREEIHKYLHLYYC